MSSGLRVTENATVSVIDNIDTRKNSIKIKIPVVAYYFKKTILFSEIYFAITEIQEKIKMKTWIPGAIAAFSGVLMLSGCFTGMEEEKTSQKVMLEPIRKGDKVITRTAYDVEPATNKVTHGQIMQLLSPYADDVNINFSISTVMLEAGQYTTLHTLKASEIFYTLSGNGFLKVNGKDHVMRPGKLIYVPAGMKQSVRNDGKVTLVYLSIISPAYKADLETDLQKLRLMKVKKDKLNKDGLFSGKFGSQPVKMKSEKLKIQTLSTNENKSPDKE